MSHRILVVCTANVCRSPMVQAMLRARLDPEVVTVGSAGVRAPQGRAMDRDSAAQLASRGVPLPESTARQLTPDLVRDADLVLTATRAHRAEVLDLEPRALRRTFTVLEFADLCHVVEAEDLPGLVAAAAAARARGPQEADLPDPIGRSVEVHADVAQRADVATAAIAERLIALGA